jgi:hypothetical protein
MKKINIIFKQYGPLFHHPRSVQTNFEFVVPYAPRLCFEAQKLLKLGLNAFFTLKRIRIWIQLFTVKRIQFFTLKRIRIQLSLYKVDPDPASKNSADLC